MDSRTKLKENVMLSTAVINCTSGKGGFTFDYFILNHNSGTNLSYLRNQKLSL